ncbi:MAG: hypothetical protein OXD50_08750 [Chloroflexi bacterium]|nr:hypothetical protein [Chloroflexota bacterium]
MTLFFDATMGVRVARALGIVKAPDLDCVTLTQHYRDTPSHGLAIPDERWLRDATPAGWLVLTQDRHILERPRERREIIDHNVGLVIIRPADAVNYDVMLFIIRRMDWLGEVDRESRPFVYRTSIHGRPSRVDLMSS